MLIASSTMSIVIYHPLGHIVSLSDKSFDYSSKFWLKDRLSQGRSNRLANNWLDQIKKDITIMV